MRAWVGFTAFTASIGFILAIGGCSGSKDNNPLSDDSTGGNGGGSGDNGGGSGFQSTGDDSTGMFAQGDSGSGPTGNSGPCKGGHYTGMFTGSYTSHLTGVGIPIPVTGNVDMTLDQSGTADMTCEVHGEVPVP